MESSDIVYALLKQFTSKNRSYLVNFYEFVKFFLHYMERDDTERFKLFKANTTDVITAQLLLLEEKGSCTLSYNEQKIDSICFGDYFKKKLVAKYKEVENSAEEPFPNEESCDFKLPSEMVESVTVKEEFSRFLKRSDLANINYIRLLFPSGIRDVLLTGPILIDRLPLFCLKKIQIYLNQKNNANYLLRKLISVLNQSEQAVHDALRRLRTSPEGILEEIRKPSATSFAFWVHVSNFILKDLENKNEKQTLEHSFCQSSYIIGYLNAHYRDQINKEQQRINFLNGVGRKIRKPPYTYSLQDILEFKDGENLLLNDKYSRKELLEYLEEKATPGKGDSLPELLRLQPASREECYMHREIIVPFCYNGITNAHKHYRHQILGDWEDKLRSFKTVRSMKEDEFFRRKLERQFKKDEPLLYSLLRYELLFLAINQNPKASFAAEVGGYLNNASKTLLPIDEILRLRRKELLDEAKRGLPFWRSIPILAEFIIALMKFFSSSRAGKKKSKASAGNSSEDRFEDDGSKKNRNRDATHQKVAYKKRMDHLAQTFMDGSKNLEAVLFDLAEEWNPLWEPKAKANLVEDVNSLTRDYLKNLRRGFLISPPDEERIRNIARLLGENEGLALIKKRELLIRYLELYIIQCLR